MQSCFRDQVLSNRKFSLAREFKSVLSVSEIIYFPVLSKNLFQVHRKNPVRSRKHAEDALSNHFRQLLCLRCPKTCKNFLLLSGREALVDLQPGDALQMLEMEVEWFVRLLDDFTEALELFSGQRVEENENFLVHLEENILLKLMEGR